MDQGLAAYWAASIGVGGAVLGAIAAGFFTTRAARLGGEKAVEAAETAAQRAAGAEHQHWLRQQRYEAYNAFSEAAETMLYWDSPVDPDAANQHRQLLIRTTTRVRTLGPQHVANQAVLILNVLMEAAQTSSQPYMQWTEESRAQLAERIIAFGTSSRDILAQPPT